MAKKRAIFEKKLFNVVKIPTNRQGHQTLIRRCILSAVDMIVDKSPRDWSNNKKATTQVMAYLCYQSNSYVVIIFVSGVG